MSKLSNPCVSSSRLCSSCPVGGSGGLSDFLPFPLELRFPQCFRAGRDAHTDSRTEEEDRIERQGEEEQSEQGEEQNG